MKEQFIILDRGSRVVGRQLAGHKARAVYLFAAKFELSPSNLKAVTYAEFAPPPRHDADSLERVYREEIAAKRRMNALDEQAEIDARRADDAEVRMEYMMLHGTE